VTNETHQPSVASRAPSVSVIIPTFNYARYLAQAVESVQAQTLRSWECIVVDDGSTDSTPVLLDALARSDPRIVVRRQAAAGVSAARNAGLAAARGKYVQFLDADDRLHSTKLALSVEVLESRPDIDLVYGSASFISEADGESLRELADPSAHLAAPLPEAAGKEVLSLLVVHNLFVVEAPLIRKHIFDRVGIFDERLARMEDWDLWLRIALADARFASLPGVDPSVVVRVHAGSASQRGVEMVRAELAVRERLDPLLADLPAQRAANAERMIENRMELAVVTALEGRVLTGLRVLAPLAARSVRPRWMLWALLLPAAAVAPGRRLLGRVWSRRRGRAQVG